MNRISTLYSILFIIFIINNIHIIVQSFKISSSLESKTNANIIVILEKKNSNIIERHIQMRKGYKTKQEKISDLVDTLKDFTYETQKPLNDFLLDTLLNREMDENGNTEPTPFTSSTNYWITNKIYIENATSSLVKKLEAFNSSIKEIREEYKFKLIHTKVKDKGHKHKDKHKNTNKNKNENNYTDIHNNIQIRDKDTIEWGVQHVRAPKVWKLGNKGEGIVIGSIDTGARYTHEIIKHNFREEFGWFDPERFKLKPYDAQGHGTHTIGSIVGKNGFGVAPGAKWIACKGCRSRNCRESELLACGEFMTCPTDPTRTDSDCSKAPDIVTNSWGGPAPNDFYSAVIETWRAVGIIPVFANGNVGSKCNSLHSPADNADVIAVGAVDLNNNLASFSSRGPSSDNRIKPDISAPGVNILSGLSKEDHSYGADSGTSMATPHVSGVIALILKAHPGITYDGVYNLITKTAVRPKNSISATCGGVNSTIFPNNGIGYGIIDAYKAVTSKI